MSVTAGLTVLFDGGCPLCSREIAHYRRLTSRRPIQWLDITLTNTDLSLYGITPEAAMAEFHVRDEAGHWHKGVDGFLLLWLALPYFHWLARLCQLAHLQPLMRWGYGHFARWHLKRRCQSGVCR